MTGSAAEKLAREKKEEKVEKRRALGRGLASLLPGPRVVAASTESRVPGAESGSAAPPQAQPESFLLTAARLKPWAPRRRRLARRVAAMAANSRFLASLGMTRMLSGMEAVVGKWLHRSWKLLGQECPTRTSLTPLSRLDRRGKLSQHLSRTKGMR